MRDFENIPNDQLFNNQLISMYEKSLHDDPRIRTYLALAMGQTKNKIFCETLHQGFKDKDMENKIAAIKACGLIGCDQSIEFLNNLIINANHPNIKRKPPIGVIIPSHLALVIAKT